MKKTTSTILATAVAGLLIGASTGCGADESTNTPAAGEASPTSVPAQTAPDAATDVHSCKGLNDCTGKGGCESGDNGCKGKNSCKGKGGCEVKAKN